MLTHICHILMKYFQRLFSYWQINHNGLIVQVLFPMCPKKVCGLKDNVDPVLRTKYIIIINFTS